MFFTRMHGIQELETGKAYVMSKPNDIYSGLGAEAQLKPDAVATGKQQELEGATTGSALMPKESEEELALPPSPPSTDPTPKSEAAAKAERIQEEHELAQVRARDSLLLYHVQRYVYVPVCYAIN